MTEHRRSFPPGLLAATLLIALATPAAGQSLYWLDAEFTAPRLGKSGLDGSGEQTASLDPASLPEGLTWIPAENRLLLAELAFTGARILQFSQDLQSNATVITGESALRNVTVDQDSARMYWTSSNLVSGARIKRSKTDGTSSEVLFAFAPGTANLRGIALDPINRRMYWADFTQGTISRAEMKAGATSETVLSGLQGPAGVQLDASANAIYWCEAAGNMIRRATLDGSGETTILTGLSSPYSLAIDTDAGKIYWTELGNPRIRKANLDGTGVQTLPISVGHPTGILILPGGATDIQASREDVPRDFALFPTYPNPFNPSTTFRYALPVTGDVTLSIHDALGRLIAEVSRGTQEAGVHEILWQGEATLGREVSSGVYFARMTVSDKTGSVLYTAVQRLVLLK